MINGELDMKKSLKKSLSILLVVLTLISVTFIAPVPALAKAGASTKKAIQLKNNTTYKKYDINGDGKADKIRVVYKTYNLDRDETAKATIYINGKKKKVFTSGYAVTVYLIAPTSKKVYLIVDYYYKDAVSDAYVYRYTKGKFKKCRSGSIYEPFSYGKVTSVTKNSLSLKISTGKYERGLIDDYYGKPVSFKVDYGIKNHKFTLKSKLLSAYSNSYTAKRSFSTSSTYTTNDYKGCYVRAGSKVSITHCYISGDYEVAFKISCNGSTGWLVNSDGFSDGEYPLLK